MTTLSIGLDHSTRTSLSAQIYSAIRDAIDRDSHDWSLWLIRARLETKSGEISAALESLEHARRLNPLAPLPPA